MVAHHFRPWSGIASRVWLEAKGLTKFGFNIHIVASVPLPNQFERIFFHSSYFDRPLPPYFRYQLKATIGSSLRIYKILKESRIDIFHIHVPTPITRGFSGIFAKRISGQPFILDLHDLWRNDYLSYNPQALLARTLMLYMFNESDLIITPGKILKSRLMNLGIEEKKIKLVPNVVNTRQFNPNIKRPSVKELYGIKGPLIFYHGHIMKMKGIDQLIKAAPKILKEIPETRFMIIGSGPDLPQIISLIREFDLTQSFVLTGQVPREHLLDCLSSADVCVSTPHRTPANEAYFPIKVLEYMAMEKPVVATKVAEISNMIQHNMSGLLADPEDTEDIVSQIVRVLQDPRLAERLGQRARERVLKKYAAESVGKRLKSIYESL